MSPAPFIRGCGVALIGAGLLTIVVNGVVTPVMPRGGALSETAASSAF